MSEALRTPPSTRRAVVVVTLVITALLSCGRIREDEAYCEEALARLKECCGSTAVDALSCDFDSGCGYGPTEPDFSVQAARCLLETSCDAIRDAGKCTSLARGQTSGRATNLEEEACR